MGLDIYVEWQGMTEAENDAQITGYRPAPEHGYLRYGYNENYTGDLPRLIYPRWSGWNDDTLRVTPYVLKRLNKLRKSLARKTASRLWPEYDLIIRLIKFIESKKDRRGLKLKFS